MELKFGPRPNLEMTKPAFGPRLVRKFVPLKKLRYAKLERVFRTFHPDSKPTDLDKLWDAFNFMKLKHKGQTRKSETEPYHIHPFNVAYYMAQAGGSLDEVVAALLHDTVEDTDTSIEEIEHNFGSNVANIVSLLSTPKIRQFSENPKWMSHDGVELPLVYPDHSHYADAVYKKHLQETLRFSQEDIGKLEKEKKQLKREHRGLFVDIQKNRIFPSNTPITDLHWSAIWIKQFDALHNLQTIGGLKPEETLFTCSKSFSAFKKKFESHARRASGPLSGANFSDGQIRDLLRLNSGEERNVSVLGKTFCVKMNGRKLSFNTEDERGKFVSKSLDMALFLSDRLTPAIGRSVDPDVLRIIEGLKRKGAPVSHLLPRSTDPKKWYLMLPPRDRLTYRKLMKIPPVTDKVVNIHHVMDVEKVKGTENFHEKISDNHFEVLIPYHLIGSSEQSFKTFFDELKFHLNPESNLLERGRVGQSQRSPSEPNLQLPIVLPGKSLLRPGVSGFHVFDVNLSQLELPNARAYRERLLNAVRHTLVRYTSKSLLHLPVTFRNGIVNKTPSQLLWLPSNNDPNHVAIFLPHLQFNRKLSFLIPRLREFSSPSMHIGSIHHEPTHMPAHTFPSFHTFILKFKDHATASTRKRVLDQLGHYLRSQRLKQSP